MGKLLQSKEEDAKNVILCKLLIEVSTENWNAKCATIDQLENHKKPNKYAKN